MTPTHDEQSRSTDGDGDGGHSLERIQRAALDRALVDADAAPSSLALVGALERARTERQLGGNDAVAATLCCLATVFALDTVETAESRTPVAPATPRLTDETAGLDRLARTGAALAVRRFGVELDRAASLADVPRSELERRLDE